MWNDERLQVRREALIERLGYLANQIPLMQREEQAVRGQIQLIAEMLGEVPAPPGAAGEAGDAADKPNGRPEQQEETHVAG